MYKTFTIGLSPEENHTTALTGEEMHSPFGGWCYHLAPRLRGKSGAAGKGEASAASQSAECLSCHMTQKGESVTLIL